MRSRTVVWRLGIGALLGLLAFVLLLAALDPELICQTSDPPNCTVDTGIPGLAWHTQNWEWR